MHDLRYDALTVWRRDTLPRVSAVSDWQMVGQAKDSDGQQLPRASSKKISVDNIVCLDLYDRDGGVVSLNLWILEGTREGSK